MGLNIIQQVFTLFYAIAWGTAANSQPRWGAFSYAAIGKKEGVKVILRIILAWSFLNIAPVCYFVLVVGSLNSASWNITLYPWTITSFWRMVLAIIIAFAPFGFYKFWMGIVQIANEKCFTKTEIESLQNLPQYQGRAFEGGEINILAGFLIVAVLGFIVCLLE